MSLTKVAASFPVIQNYFTRYGLSILLVLGNFGSLCNIIIFSSNRGHRANSCSLYLLAAAFFNFTAVNFGLAIVLYDLDHPDSITQSKLFCKIKAYIIHVLFNVSRWLVVLACADRFALCHKQARIRSWSSPRFARRAIAVVACAWTIIALHVPIWQGFSLGVCRPYGVYALVWGIYQFIIVGLLPPVAMIIFGFLTMNNLHSIRSHVRTRSNSTTIQLHPRDVNMMRMVSAEILVYILTNIGHPISQLYLTISDNIIAQKSTSRKQIESFVLYLTQSLLIYVYFSITFYIYMIVSRSFRQDFKRLFSCCASTRIATELGRKESVLVTNLTRKYSRQLPAPPQASIGS